MEYIWILPIAFVILLEITAIIVVANEDILYENEVMDYAFWDYYTTSQSFGHSGSDDGCGSGGD